MDAPLETTTVYLRRVYPALRELFQLTTFHVGEPLRVWTQNAQLRSNFEGVENTDADPPAPVYKRYAFGLAQPLGLLRRPVEPHCFRPPARRIALEREPAFAQRSAPDRT